MLEQLKKIKVLDELINVKIAECDRLWSLATKVNSICEGDRVQSSGSGDSMSEAISKLIDLRTEINADIDRFVDMKQECLKQLDSLDDQLLIGILYRRYFQYKTWDAIADELNITRQWATEKHRRFVNSCF